MTGLNWAGWPDQSGGRRDYLIAYASCRGSHGNGAAPACRSWSVPDSRDGPDLRDPAVAAACLAALGAMAMPPAGDFR